MPKSTRKRAPKRAQTALALRDPKDSENQQLAEHLAQRRWAAMVGETVLDITITLLQELLTPPLLDEDDEEGGGEGRLDDHDKRYKKILADALIDGFNRCPDFNAANNLPRPNSDLATAKVADELKTVLAKIAIGATKFKDFPYAQLEQLVRLDIERRLKNNPKYKEYVRGQVPGRDVRNYGSLRCTSSLGTFYKAKSFVRGGGLDALLTGGWLHVARQRIDPEAWSYRHGYARHTDQQNWLQHFIITDRNGIKSLFKLPRKMLLGRGRPALQRLMQSGMQPFHRKRVPEALVAFLRYRPKHEIVRMPRVGGEQVGSHWIFVRPDGVLTPSNMPQADNVTYELDAVAIGHGLHVAGSTAGWMAEVAEPLRGNSVVALSCGTFFAAPLLRWANEPGGGFHPWGTSTIGKSMASAVGQSINGWPFELDDDAFGVSWGASEAGIDAFILARADLGIAFDEITRSKPRIAEQIMYKLASGTRDLRATSAGSLRDTSHVHVLVFSTGEKSTLKFVGDRLQEGARKRLVDVPAEVRPGSAFETIPPERIHSEAKRLFDAMKRHHGAVGRDWQRYLVDIGPDQIKAQLQEHRQAFAALPEVVAIEMQAHPQVRAVVNRFALVAAALRLVITVKLLPWSVEESDTCIVACMKRWVKQRDNINTAGEVVRAAQQIVQELVSGLSDRFIHIHKCDGKWTPVSEVDEFRQRTPENFYGYAKPEELLVRPEIWRVVYCNGFDPTAVAKYFAQRGVLISDDKSLSKTEPAIGGNARFYVLRRAALTALTS